jgi:hypothetical protein
VAFASPYAILGANAIFNVGVRTDPFDDFAGFIAQRIRSKEKPPKKSITTAQARFDFTRAA